MKRIFFLIFSFWVFLPFPVFSKIESKSPLLSRVDWKKFKSETVDLLKIYLRVDTSNPPGNELKGCEFFRNFFDKHQLSGSKVFEIAPGRGNIYHRLKGNGKKKPILLTNHLDVVAADEKNWTHPPFSGKEVNGEIWGRGALDMKTGAIVDAMLLKIIFQKGFESERDIIFLGCADEESDSLGADWMVKNHPELLDAEFALNEGATGVIRDGKLHHWGVSPMEKTVLWLELKTHGTAGHGSTPSGKGALDRLLRGLSKISENPPPIKWVPSVQKYFQTLLPIENSPAGEQFRKNGGQLEDPILLKIVETDPEYNALLRNTIAITSVQSGEKVNVIPGEAKALLDCRLLPGSDKQEFLENLKKILGDPSIEISESLYFPTLESPVETELMRVIRRVCDRFDPGVAVVPFPLTGTTDSTFFRQLGIITYGFEPVRLTPEEILLQHGPNERISRENIELHLEFKFQILEELCGLKPGRIPIKKEK